MSPPFYSAEQIAAALFFKPLIEHLRFSHCQAPALVERALLQQINANGAQNNLLVWPAWQKGGDIGTKLVTVFPENHQHPSVQALYVLMNGQNGSVKALLDGTELTYWKTAADSALGADYLARQDASTFLMVGAGQLAPYLIKAYLAIRPHIKRIVIWNRTHSKAVLLAQNLTQELASNLQIAATEDLATAVHQADIICSATNSYEPLVNGAWLQEGQHLDLVGSYTPQMREVDDLAIQRSNVYVDSRWFTIDCAGDLTQPIANGVFKAEEVVADLFELCSQQKLGRTSAQQITLFKSGGGAHLDLMTASYVAQMGLANSAS